MVATTWLAPADDSQRALCQTRAGSRDAWPVGRGALASAPARIPSSELASS